MTAPEYHHLAGYLEDRRAEALRHRHQEAAEAYRVAIEELITVRMVQVAREIAR